MEKNEETILIELVFNAAKLFYEENKNIVEELNIHECVLSTRLAFYLQSLLNLNPNCEEYKGYIVDCEYNRNGNNVKHCKDLTKKVDEKELSIRPDIIIHKRKEEDNLIVIELKKSHSSSKRKDTDKDRLEYFTCKNFEYKYKLGVFVLIGKEKFELTFFRNGKDFSKFNYSAENNEFIKDEDYKQGE